MGPAANVVCFAYYPRHLPRLARTVARYLEGWHGGTVVLVTAPQLGAGAHTAFEALPATVIEQRDDGRGWEFGAYQRGLDTLAAMGLHGAVAVFNDTAGVHYPLPAGELARLRRAARDDDALTPVLSGGVQAAPDGFALHGLAVPAWVRSNAFVLSAAARVALQDRVFVAEDFGAPRVDAQGLWLPDWVSPALQRYLQDWLMSRGPQGWRAHAGWAEPPAEVLRGKAGSILLEKRLAATVLAAGGSLVSSGRPGDSLMQQVSRRAFYLSRRLAHWRGPQRSAGQPA